MRSYYSGVGGKPTDLLNYTTKLSLNESSGNRDLLSGMIADSHKYLLQKYFFNESTTTIPTVANQQFYNLPYNFSQLKDITITQGSLKWVPKEVFTREDWDRLNPFPYYSDIPNNFFIYNGQIGIWPIPATTANTLTFNYKIRVPDLTFADYINGTCTMTNASATVTGAGGTAWMTNYLPSAGSVLNMNLWLRATAPNGDNNWYKISSIESDTSLTLLNTYTGATKAGCSYTIGQMPLLLEDYHDLLVYRPLMLYFSSIVDNPNKKKEFTDFYNEGIAKMDSYAGKKTIQVNLRQQINSLNPNIFPQSIGGTP